MPSKRPRVKKDIKQKPKVSRHFVCRNVVETSDHSFVECMVLEPNIIVSK